MNCDSENYSNLGIIKRIKFQSDIISTGIPFSINLNIPFSFSEYSFIFRFDLHILHDSIKNLIWNLFSKYIDFRTGLKLTTNIRIKSTISINL